MAFYTNSLNTPKLAWLFPTVAVPLTIVTFGIWYLWQRREETHFQRRNLNTDVDSLLNSVTTFGHSQQSENSNRISLSSSRNDSDLGKAPERTSSVLDNSSDLEKAPER